MKRILLAAIIAPALLPGASIGFEGLGNETIVADLFEAQGVTFINATALVQGIGLSPIFPPANGMVAASDIPGSPMILSFTVPVHYFEAFFTWTDFLNFQLFDSLGVNIGNFQTTVPANFVGSGETPNQKISFRHVPGIKQINIFTIFPSDSFTIDAITFSPIPEPSPVALAAPALLMALSWRRRHRRGGPR
jgi:hypothetical protein